MVLFNSIKRRLIALHLIAVLAVAVVLPLALYWRVDATARALHERALREQAEQIVQYLHRLPDGTWALDLPNNLRQLYSVSYNRYGFAILTQSGRVLFSSRGSDEPLFPSQPREDRPIYGERNVGQSRFFDASVPITIGSESLWVQISQDQAHRDVLIDDIVAEFLPHVAWVVIPILAVLLGIDFVIFGKALHPLAEASKLAQQIGPARTDLRLPEARMPRDVLPLVRAVNGALDRLERGFTAQREFVADAAHELRTPLAILRAEVEAGADQDAASGLLADIDSMTRIVNQLIDTAESDTLAIGPADIADLQSICTDVASFMAPVAVAQCKSISVTGPSDPVWVEGNGQALFLAVRNLVENAITHTATGTTVGITVWADGSVAVSDEGAGIPVEQRDVIFQRFWRGDRRRPGSAGLGLSIVARIVKAHGGTITVRDAVVRGAVFTMQVPLAGGGLSQTSWADMRHPRI
ncbi:MAG: ATP-binding protein [Rhodopila sp.]|nr:ATP-binding protein [Rhodopila sp.]